MWAGMTYLEQIKATEGLSTQEVIKKYGSNAIYVRYYPDGFSACVRDQKCRGNKEARTACLKLIQGDPSMIKVEAGMGKSVLGDLFGGDECSKCFKETRLGVNMQATAISGSVVSNVILDRDPYRDTGGVANPSGKSALSHGVEAANSAISNVTSKIKMPDFGIGVGTKAVGAVAVLFVVGIIALIAIGYSGLGGSAGRVAEREHKRSRK